MVSRIDSNNPAHNATSSQVSSRDVRRRHRNPMANRVMPIRSGPPRYRQKEVVSTAFIMISGSKRPEVATRMTTVPVTAQTAARLQEVPAGH